METTISKKFLELCDGLLRGEISAVETYDIAIKKFEKAQAITELSEIRSGHQESVTKLRSHIQSLGGTPSTDSGAWGTFATAVEKAASLLGDTSAVTALIQGEEYGIGEYESSLEGTDLSDGTRTLISEELLPKLHRNLEALEHLK